MKKKLNCVLLIDDNDDTNFFNRRLLMKMDVTEKIQIATSGEEALDFLSNGGRFLTHGNNYPAPMLIFLDINMPGMDGWEFLEEYHRLPPEQKGKIVLIMLTSSPNPDDAEKAKANEDVSDFVKKPLSLEAMEKVLKDYFPDLNYFS